MTRLIRTLTAACFASLLLAGFGCSKKFEIRDVDPGKASEVRSLGPESQDALSISDDMTRSLLQTGLFDNLEDPATMVMLPMENNTRHAFNQEVFTSLLKSELNKKSEDRFLFVARDLNEDVIAEREMKREGRVDYDPEKRSTVPAGADYFLKGRADGLANVSTKGQSDFIVYTFKLVDTETQVELWEDSFQTKKEGKDDVIYR